jgi:hypothetical protein
LKKCAHDVSLGIQEQLNYPIFTLEGYAMSNCKNSTDSIESRFVEEGSRAYLDEIVRQGARRMLIEALEKEVDEYIEKHEDKTDKGICYRKYGTS